MSLTCCFTGHRPQKLPWGFIEKGARYERFLKRLDEEILRLISEGFRHFITGMAQGVDILAGEAVLRFKEDYPDLSLECAVPYEGQEKRWSKKSQERYLSLLQRADAVTTVVKGGYTEFANAARNRYMVDKADAVIAGFNGGSGGTRQTIEYALSLGKRVIIINV